MSGIIILNKENSAVQYLCNKDRRLSKIIDMVGEIIYQPYNDGYSFIIHEIIEQMLSIKSGAKIYARLQELCSGKFTPDEVSRLSDEEIKSIGTSNSKVMYIRNITDACQTGKIDLNSFDTLSDEEIYRQLIKIQGIGDWTIKMYLIFVLDRQDVLPAEDVAFL